MACLKEMKTIHKLAGSYQINQQTGLEPSISLSYIENSMSLACANVWYRARLMRAEERQRWARYYMISPASGVKFYLLRIKNNMYLKKGMCCDVGQMQMSMPPDLRSIKSRLTVRFTGERYRATMVLLLLRKAIIKIWDRHVLHSSSIKET